MHGSGRPTILWRLSGLERSTQWQQASIDLISLSAASPPLLRFGGAATRDMSKRHKLWAGTSVGPQTMSADTSSKIGPHERHLRVYRAVPRG